MFVFEFPPSWSADMFTIRSAANRPQARRVILTGGSQGLLLFWQITIGRVFFLYQLAMDELNIFGGVLRGYFDGMHTVVRMRVGIFLRVAFDQLN